MKKLLQHIASYFFLGGLLLALSSQVYAQTPAGTQIDNIGRAKFLYLNGTQDSVQSNMVSSIVEGWGTLSLNKTVSDSIVSIGDTVQFKIVVGYSGNLHASNVIVTDTVPSHFRVINSTKGIVNGNIVKWNVGTVLPNAPDSIVVMAVVKLLANGTYNVINTAFAADSVGTISANTGVIIITANRILDVSLRKTVLVDTSYFGDILPYSISAVNTGNTELQTVTVIDTLPSMLDFVDVTDNRIEVNNGILTLKMPVMQVADSISFTMRTRVARVDIENRKILNTVYLTAEVPTDSLTSQTKLANRTNGTIWIGRSAAASAVIVKFNPALSITKTASKDTVFANDTVDYKITLKNTGDAPLLNVVMNDELSFPLHNILLVSSNLTRVNNTVTLTLDTLAVGNSVVASVRAAITAYVDTGVTNRAFVQSSFTPKQSASVVIPMKIRSIASVGSIQLTKIASRDSIANGDSVKYVIRFRNNGGVTLKNVVISDTLPNTLTKNVVLYNKGRIFGNIVSYYRDSLVVGQTDSVVIVSVVNGDIYNNQSIINTAFAESDQTFITSSSAGITALVAPVYKLGLTKTASKQAVFTEDSLRYTIKVRNTGNRILTNIVVSDTIPFQLTNISATNAVVNGKIVTFHRDTLKVNEVDSFIVRASVIANRPNDEAILNTAIALTNQTKEQIAQAIVIIVPKSSVPSDLKLTKSVSKDTVFIGDTLTYKITITNAGTTALTNIALSDTLPYQLSNASVSSNASINGKIISFSKAVLAPGQSEVITVIAKLSLDIFEYEIVLNRAFAQADQVKEITAHALFVAKNDPACVLTITATPDRVIGNGRSAAYIEVHLTNTLGNPKPDGSPILMTTIIGTFGNGQTSRVLYTKNGIVSDSLRATKTGRTIANAFAIVSADNGVGCKDEDTVKIIFYPGAIEGTVYDMKTERTVLGAIVKAFSLTTDSLAGTEITKADGYYLIPVERTDSFRVTIRTTNEFGKETEMSTTVVVNISGDGDLPTPNVNSVSGAIYYLVSNEPIASQNITILLMQATSTAQTNKTGYTKNGVAFTTIDSTTTEHDGTYTFKIVPAGKFLLTLKHPWVQGSLELSKFNNGRYTINANIAITLNPNIVFSKTGPSRVALTDTATYKITVQNTGTLSTTNTVLIDSLHWAMKFVSASSGGLYDQLGHRIVWNIGKIDSLSARSYDVKVRFVDTLKNSTQSLNRASITSNQTTLIRDSVQTLVFLSPTMRMWKVSNVQSAFPGDTVLYSIKLNNTAGSRADSVVISDRLPSQIQFLGSQVRYYQKVPQAILNDTVLYNNISHSISWKRDTILVGDSATITLITRVRNDLEPGDHRYTNIALMTWNGGTLQSDIDSASSATVRSLVSYLRITKQALRKVVEIGDIATYIVRVTNASTTSFARDIQVVDKIPFGFRYMNGSSFIDSTRIADPTGRKELFWLLKDSLAAGASVQFVYRLVVGAGAAEGNGINTAQAFGVSQYGTPMVSAEVAERVEVRRGVFTTHGLIIGKVFYDDNRNRYQDSAEVGVKGIELMMEDGTRIITGDDGKYSVPDVLPGEHVIRVRTHTLPKDASLEMGYNDFARDSTSRFVRLTESGIARVDFYLARNISLPDSLVLSQAIAKIGDFSIQRIASPRNIVFIEDQRLASMKLTGLNFEVGKAVLRPEAFVTLKQLADILRDYSDQPLIIAGHTDSMKISTPEFPNNKILSMSRAMAVKNYLVEREGINVDRIRIQGHGETKPLATNKSIDGRALNRRVEFYFTPSTDENPITEMPVAIEIPIEYTGTEYITKVDFRDILNSSFKYVVGSATFGDSTITPQINGNELHWKLTNLGSNFKYTLRYSVMIQRPEVYTPTTVTSSSASICYFIGDSALHCIDTLTTTNEVAIAVRGRAVNFVMSGVLFDVAKSSLRSAALSSLEVTAKFLNDDPTATALIEGHTDSSPIKTKEFPSNVELSIARANTIKQKLIVNFGIAPERLQTIGYGERRPSQSNETKEGRQVNRRIEMRILRSEFAQNVLPEGMIDSSKRAVETLLPKNAPKGISSVLRDKSKERYILTLEIKRLVKRNTVATTIIDTIPAGLNLLQNSITNVLGIDSVTVQGKVLTIKCSPNAQSVKLYYIAEVSDDVKNETTLEHGFTVTKKQTDGTVIEQRTPSVKIEIRKKQLLVRY